MRLNVQIRAREGHHKWQRWEGPYEMDTAIFGAAQELAESDEVVRVTIRYKDKHRLQIRRAREVRNPRKAQA